MEWQSAKSKALEHYRKEEYLESIKNAKLWYLETVRVGCRQEERIACKILAWSYKCLGEYEKSINFGLKELEIAKEEKDKDAEEEAYAVLALSYAKRKPDRWPTETMNMLCQDEHESYPGSSKSQSLTNLQEGDPGQLTLAPCQENDDQTLNQAAEEQRFSSERTGSSEIQSLTNLQEGDPGQLTLEPCQENDDQILNQAAEEKRFSSERTVVPSEIIARGPEAKRAYENALKNGKVKVYRGRIMLIGQDRAGKTSLKKHLLGLPFDPDEESTDEVEVDPSAFEFDVDHATNWKISSKKLDVSHFVNKLAKMVAAELQEQKINVNQEGQDEENRVSKMSLRSPRKN